MRRTAISTSGIEPLEVEILRQADAQFANGAARLRQIVSDGFLRRGLVAWIVPGNSLQRDGRIAHRTRQRAHVIEREIERHHAVAAHAAAGGLESHGSAERRRDANRAAGIAAHGHENHFRRDRRARSAARSAGDALGIPGIANGAEVRIIRRDAISQLMHAGFADEHRAGRCELFDHGGIAIGNMVEEDDRAAGGAHAARFENVLHGNRNAVQRPAIGALRQFFIGRLGLRAGALSPWWSAWR